MFLGEMTKVKNPSVIYEDNQGAIYLSKNRQVGIRKNIEIRHYSIQGMVKYKDIDIQYIRNEDNPAEIMEKNTSEADFARHINSTTEGKLWEIVDNGRESFNNTRLTDDAITRDKT